MCVCVRAYVSVCAAQLLAQTDRQIKWEVWEWKNDPGQGVCNGDR